MRDLQIVKADVKGVEAKIAALQSRPINAEMAMQLGQLYAGLARLQAEKTSIEEGKNWEVVQEATSSIGGLPESWFLGALVKAKADSRNQATTVPGLELSNWLFARGQVKVSLSLAFRDSRTTTEPKADVETGAETSSETETKGKGKSLLK